MYRRDRALVAESASAPFPISCSASISPIVRSCASNNASISWPFASSSLEPSSAGILPMAFGHQSVLGQIDLFAHGSVRNRIN